MRYASFPTPWHRSAFSPLQPPTTFVTEACSRASETSALAHSRTSSSSLVTLASNDYLCFLLFLAVLLKGPERSFRSPEQFYSCRSSPRDGCFLFLIFIALSPLPSHRSPGILLRHDFPEYSSINFSHFPPEFQQIQPPIFLSVQF